MENEPNQHMWIPDIFDVLPEADPPEQQSGEICRLCGVFRDGATPTPTKAAQPCPIPWPSLPELTKDEIREREHRLTFPEGLTLKAWERHKIIHLKCRACGTLNAYDEWLFAGKFCPQCGSRNGALRV
jgi:hypothetical protein